MPGKTGARMYVVTQFFFDAAPVVEWETKLRKERIELPVYVGLHGLTSIKKLISYGIKCGIGNSLQTLTKQPSRLLKLAAVQQPDRLLLDIVSHNVRTPQSLFKKPHFFALGGFAATANWIGAIERGDFEIEEDRQGMRVSYG